MEKPCEQVHCCLAAVMTLLGNSGPWTLQPLEELQRYYAEK